MSETDVRVGVRASGYATSDQALLPDGWLSVLRTHRPREHTAAWTAGILPADPGRVDEHDHAKLLSQVDGDTAEVVAALRAEIDRRRARGEDADQLGQLLMALEPVVREVHEIATIDAIRVAITQHGGGPYPVEDLAAIAGVTPADAHRALQTIVAAGLAWPNPPTDDPAR